MILEPAKPEDLEAVNQLAIQVHDLHVTMQPQYFVHMDCLYSADRFRKALEDKALYVAKLDCTVVGYVLLSMLEANHPGVVAARTMRVEELCVADGYRHIGIGRRMMEDVQHIAKEAYCTDIRLTCAPQNTAANKFYDSLGMEIKTLQYCIKI